MFRVFSLHFGINLFDNELATKFLDVTPQTFGRHPTDEVGFSLVDLCFGQACYCRNFREELVEGIKVTRAWVLACKVELHTRVAEVVLFQVKIERDSIIGHSHC